MNSTEKSIFRVIRESDNQWVGNGFIFVVDGASTQPVYVTCAHVVGDALGDRSLSLKEEAPNGRFYVDFPNSGYNSKFYARVYQNDPVAWHPLEKNPNERRNIQDLALIAIERATLPLGTKATVICSNTVSVSGDKVFAFGGAVKNTNYANNVPRVAEGVIQVQAGSLLQIRAFDPSDNAFIEPGFSGGPIWSERSGEVLGLVSMADLEARLAWITPSNTLRDMLRLATRGAPNTEPDEETEPTYAIPFDFQPRGKELILKRKDIEYLVDQKVDSAFLLYFHGEQNTGKSSEIQRLMASQSARMVKERTIWQTCTKHTQFTEMADYIAEDCLRVTSGKKFGARELIRALRARDLCLVLDGYSPSEHPSLTPLIDTAAPLEKPTHLLVTSNADPTSTEVSQCAIRIPRVGREEVIASIEALGLELPIQYAHLIGDKEFEASAAYRIVDQVRNGIASTTHISASENRAWYLYAFEWSQHEREVMECTSLIETELPEDVFCEICKQLNLSEPDKFKSHLLAESLIRVDAPRNFTVRDFCRKAIVESLSTEVILRSHEKLGHAFSALLKGKYLSGFATPTFDILYAIRSIRHFQISGTNTVARTQRIKQISRSAARKGLHRHLSEVIQCEVDKATQLDPWLYIQLIQSELAQGRIKESFVAAKIAQRAIFSTKKVSIDLIVSLCNQFASILDQAGETPLAANLLGVSKSLFASDQVSPSIHTIRDSLKAWCDGKLGKPGAARAAGLKLLSQAKEASGDRQFMQLGVESTRLGILEGNSGNFELADLLLSSGVENFSRCDRRGEIWALSHLCFFRILASSTEIPEEPLERLIDLQSTSLLISEETFSHFQVFDQALQNHPLHARIVNLDKQFRTLYERRSLSSYEVEYTEALIEFLRLEHSKPSTSVRKSGSHIDEYLSTRRMSEASEPGVSYVRGIVESNPRRVISLLYEEVPTQLLLSSPFYSRILTSSLIALDDSALIDAFVVSFLDLIKSGPRMARLHFAGFLERCGRADKALLLLNSIRNDESFRYHNISANCYKETDFDKALFHNEQALQKARSPEEQSRIFNNLSALYLIHAKRHLFGVARIQLERSIELRASHFYWPFRTKLALDLLEANDESVDSIVAAYSKDQKLSERAVKYVSRLLSCEPSKKLLFLSIAPT